MRDFSFSDSRTLETCIIQMNWKLKHLKYLNNFGKSHSKCNSNWFTVQSTNPGSEMSIYNKQILIMIRSFNNWDFKITKIKNK